MLDLLGKPDALGDVCNWVSICSSSVESNQLLLDARACLEALSCWAEQKHSIMNRKFSQLINTSATSAGNPCVFAMEKPRVQTSSLEILFQMGVRPLISVYVKFDSTEFCLLVLSSHRRGCSKNTTFSLLCSCTNKTCWWIYPIQKGKANGDSLERISTSHRPFFWIRLRPVNSRWQQVRLLSQLWGEWWIKTSCVSFLFPTGDRWVPW